MSAMLEEELEVGGGRKEEFVAFSCRSSARERSYASTAAARIASTSPSFEELSHSVMSSQTRVVVRSEIVLPWL